MGTVLIDLSKAFDSIEHCLLLKKMRSYGIDGDELRWFKGYLAGRKQRVIVDGASSGWSEVVCGVPQGSILGPLMFLIFVNDLPDVVSKCMVNLYADDTTIYYANKDSKKVTITLNADLSSIVDCIEHNRLKMKINKTQLMTLGRKACKHQYDQIRVNVRGTNIAKSDQVKYLGVIVDSDLSWKAHIAKIRQKAFAALASIRRTSHFLPSKTCKTMYNSTVLPHLDYCSTIWHSCSSTLSQSIERIQNYAMRTILKKPPRTPSAPLRERLNWTTLHQRRHNFMLYQVH